MSSTSSISLLQHNVQHEGNMINILQFMKLWFLLTSCNKPFTLQYATWDLAFHMIPFSCVDIEFAKSQLTLFLSERYMHPNGQVCTMYQYYYTVMFITLTTLFEVNFFSNLRTFGGLYGENNFCPELGKCFGILTNIFSVSCCIESTEYVFMISIPNNLETETLNCWKVKVSIPHPLSIKLMRFGALK